MKKALLKKLLHIHRKTTVSESLFNKFAGLEACNLLKKRLQHRYFAVNIEQFLRTSILKSIYEQLLLQSGGCPLMLRHSIDVHVQKYIFISKVVIKVDQQVSILQMFCCKRIKDPFVME